MQLLFFVNKVRSTFAILAMTVSGTALEVVSGQLISSPRQRKLSIFTLYISFFSACLHTARSNLSLCKSGLVAISDTSFFKPNAKSRRNSSVISKKNKRKRLFHIFLCKRHQFTLEIDIPFSIGRAVDNLTVLDAFLVLNVSSR